MSYDKIYEIDISDIEIDVLNVRGIQPLKDIDELMASIKKYGLLQPIVLRGEHDDEKPYRLISGQRRFLAHQKLKLKKIKAVFSGKLNNNEAILHSLVENLQRTELSHVDTAKAITNLYNAFGKDEKKVQKETGLSLRKIRGYISIEALASPKIKNKLQQGNVSPADVKRALRAAQGNIHKAEELLDLIEKYSPTKHQKKRIVDYGEQKPKASSKTIFDLAMQPQVEQSIIVSLSDDVRKGLDKATKELTMEAEELAMKVIKDWLTEQGFI